MVEINKSLDGTLEKAISASSYLKKMPSVVQDFMLLGDFKLGKAQRVTAQKLNITTGETDDPAIQNLAAQLAGLDRSQQNAVFKMSDLSDAAQMLPVLFLNKPQHKRVSAAPWLKVLLRLMDSLMHKQRSYSERTTR